MRQVIRSEGVLALWSGVSPYLAGQIPEKAIRLVVVDKLRQHFKREHPFLAPWVPELCAGTAAGAIQVLITNPAEIIKVRMQTGGQQLLADRSSRLSLLDVARQVGWRRAYTGAGACLMRDVPFSAIMFPTYGSLKRAVRLAEARPCNALEMFVAGTASGMLAAAATCPADVVKTRLQAKMQRGERPYSGLVDCARRIAAEEGGAAFFKGLVPRIARSAPQYGIMLVIYDVLCRLFGADADAAHGADSLAAALLDSRIDALDDDDRWCFSRGANWRPSGLLTAALPHFASVSFGGQGNVWGVRNNDRRVYRWTGLEWRRMPGELDAISVGADGATWGLRDGMPMRWDPWRCTWQPRPADLPMRSVSVGHDSRIWAISDDDRAFKWSKTQQCWKPRGDRFMRNVSVGCDGSVWGIERDTGTTCRWLSKPNQWRRLKDKSPLRSITVGSRRNIWATTTDNRIVYWNNETKAWLNLRERHGAVHSGSSTDAHSSLRIRQMKFIRTLEQPSHRDDTERISPEEAQDEHDLAAVRRNLLDNADLDLSEMVDDADVDDDEHQSEQ
jgi:Mitochondrial carrier protein/Tectonin domain